MQKELILIGDRVLVEPDKGSDRTREGLYLPQGVAEKEKVQAGRIVKVGPGYPLPDMGGSESEPWKMKNHNKNYFSLQAQEGDYCIFLKDSGIEIEFERKKYIVVPHSSILALVRNSML